jgi:O-antigen/teichoic acid export membrane protein
MRDARQAYFLGAAAVAASHAAGLVAGLASLWLLARILTKEMFGGYAFGVAVVSLLAAIATLGLDRTLLLRIAGMADRPGRLRGAGLALRAVTLGGAVGCLIAVALALSADGLVALGAVPEASFWLPALSLAIAPMAATMMLQAWYQANHRVPVSAAIPGLADLLRALAFVFVLLLGLGAAGVAGAFLLAGAAPALLLVWMAWGRSQRLPRRLGLGDVAKGLQFLTLRLATQGMQQVDLVMMGLLASGAATADYAVAARLAIFADYARGALKPSFSPRARRHFALGDHAAALREFDTARNLALAGALLASGGFVLLGPLVLAFFGPFSGAYPPLLILAAAYVVNAGFGMHAAWLAMLGEVGWSAALRAVGLVLFVALAAMLVPRWGAEGVALAAFAVHCLMNVAGALLAWRLAGLRAVDPVLLAAIGSAAGALLLAGAGTVGPAPVAAILALCLLLPLWRSRQVALDLLGIVRDFRRGPAA